MTLTLDELNANPTRKLAVSKLAENPAFQDVIAVLNGEYRNLGFIGRTAGQPADDKLTRLGTVEGFNKALHTIDQCVALPRPPIKEIQATYASPTPPVETKVQQRKQKSYECSS